MSVAEGQGLGDNWSLILGEQALSVCIPLLQAPVCIHSVRAPFAAGRCELGAFYCRNPLALTPPSPAIPGIQRLGAAEGIWEEPGW